MFDLADITARAKRRGFVYHGSNIYGGLANAWDYGPYGTQLKRNIENLRWQVFVQERPDMIGLDSQILMHPKVWEASGHVGGFNDPLIDDKQTGERFRADKLIEDQIESWRNDGKSDKKIKELIDKDVGAANLVPESWSPEEMKHFINIFVPINPESGQEADWTDVRYFELMFHTYQGVIQDEDDKIWLRPETAQGIFVNFKNILDTTRARIPFGMAQVGKAFRNEITPGNFLYRTREFEQMEIEYFVENDEEKAMESFKEWQELSMDWWRNSVELDEENIRFREHESDELSHYSKGTFDVEYRYPRGRGELQGIAYRTDFDLRQHQEHSNEDLQYIDPYTQDRYLPHVIEPSFGLSRTVLAVMLDAYDEEKYTAPNGKEHERVVVRFPKQLAPVKYAILPLIKKDEEMVEIAKEIYAFLAKDYQVEYDESGNIGKRYRRQDEIGTPFCITVDHQTLEDGTVTVRERDSMEQIRLPWKETDRCMEPTFSFEEAKQ